MHEKTEPALRCTGLDEMVYNLGAVLHGETLIVAKAAPDFIYHADSGILNGNRHCVHFFIGTLTTSLEMTGISVSRLMIPIDNVIMEQLLHAGTVYSAWNPGFDLFPPLLRNIVPRLGDQSRAKPQFLTYLFLLTRRLVTCIINPVRPKVICTQQRNQPFTPMNLPSNNKHNTSKGAAKSLFR